MSCLNGLLRIGHGPLAHEAPIPLPHAPPAPVYVPSAHNPGKKLKLEVQGKGQASEFKGRWSSSSSCSLYGIFFYCFVMMLP
ncbi:hypothetical protein MTR_3g011200 [Medicago truncatula]|uniref:Uncharacterized protein n=1 Tax=Medicago truncatula TaxID=3880 RepID=G7IVS0_MEDTR|nr:hypothetical protein MTR_3g011200 [Medicago truncatula]